jgi:undecaprenyl diphosphate synthase
MTPPAGWAGPRYVALITDGNGRWAQARGLSVSEGHEAGADTLRARVRDAVALGVKELTVYSFSTENWDRPEAEVQALIAMIARRLQSETPGLHSEGICIRFVGRLEAASKDLIAQMGRAQSLTEANRGMTLCIAFNYGGRAEIVDAARRLADKRVAQAAEGRQAGPLAPQSSDEEEFQACMYAPDMHDPDLVIRTGGEQRLSNYLLWQSAYSELAFRDEMWPDFSGAAFAQCLEGFGERGRRFGSRSDETPSPASVRAPHQPDASGVTSTVNDRSTR